MLRKDPFITGEYYHIWNRGIDKRIIFKLKRDYERFIMLLYISNSSESFRLDDLLNKQHKTLEEVVKDAEELEKKFGELPNYLWLRENGYNYINHYLSKYPEAFKHIKQKKLINGSSKHASKPTL